MIDPKLLGQLTQEEQRQLDALLEADDALWRPLPGPQKMAFESEASIVGYGGAAGGGKTDLAVGLALTSHRRVGIFRQNGTELIGVIDRIAELLKSRDGFNGQERIWRWSRGNTPVQIEFGSFPSPEEEKKYQGRPHDLLVFDEASNMRESAVRFLLGWLRTTNPKQRCRALLTFNPPTTAEGRWVVKFFAPWLDKSHTNPAKPGEVRWFATLNGKDTEVKSGEPFKHDGELITPMSRTFVPSRISDNPYLMGTGYMAQLQSLPEPLRSQMLHGDFDAGLEDDPWQVIPTTWVRLAQERWKKLEPVPPMDSMGVDVARGGRDFTIIARRHGMWFDVPLVYPGYATPDGPTVAGLVVAAARDGAPIHIDVIGVGSSPYDFLNTMNQPVVGVNVAELAGGLDRSGRLRFKNIRSEMWWRLREALEPANNTGIALPPDQRILSDLCSATWRMNGQVIAVASREEIADKIGRSPDFASAYCLALMDTPTKRKVESIAPKRWKEHDPYANL